MEESQIKTVPIYLLMLMLLFLSINGLIGGFDLISDPSGMKANLSLDILKRTPFLNFTIPGILLFMLFGIFPMLMIFPLISKPDTPGFGFLNIYRRYHWAWTYTLYISIMLIVWIDVQMVIFKNVAIRQHFYSFYAVVMLILVLLPSVRRYYRKSYRKSGQSSDQSNQIPNTEGK
jgi:hypothetical protein